LIQTARGVPRAGTRQAARAAGLLTWLEGVFEQVHNTRSLDAVLALQALQREAQGDELAAQEVLHKADSLAQPGGCLQAISTPT
jgi:hypothetical protein